MIFTRKITDKIHEILRPHLKKGDIVLDGTMGNGHDTLFLRQVVGSEGHVYSFDIQPEAIEATTKRLMEHQMLLGVSLICDSHIHIEQYIDRQIQGFIFNLGYLPGADKQVITTAKTTLVAVRSALKLLDKDGIGIIVSYYGHDGGKEEQEVLDNYLKELDQKLFEVIKIENYNRSNTPPIIYAIRKIK